MIRRLTILMILSLLFTLTACQKAEKENLSKFIANSNKIKPIEIEPLPNIKPVQPYAYSAQEFSDPFNSANLKPRRIRAAHSDGGPDTNRRREPLENYPLDALKMVGTVFRESEKRAIIRTPDGAVSTVIVGNYLGQNYGKIVSISEQKIIVEEQVLNSAGTWVGRNASLQSY